MTSSVPSSIRQLMHTVLSPLPDQVKAEATSGIAPYIRELSAVSEWRSVAAIIRQWLIISGSIFLFARFFPHWTYASIPAYLLTIAIIGTRQHALLALMHDATHYRLSKNRMWNDFVSDMFCSFPMGVSTDLYRRGHLQHHAHTNTVNDPYWTGMQEHEDWRWPKDQLVALRLFAFDLLGLAAHKICFLFFNWSPVRSVVDKKTILTGSERLRLVTFLFCAVGALTALHLWLGWLLFWVVPAVTFFAASVRLRSVAEHLVLESEHDLNSTRHVTSNFVERWMIAPLNLNFHLVHHLYPSIPFYNLPRAHSLIMKNETFLKNAHLTDSYLGWRKGVLAEVITWRNA